MEESSAQDFKKVTKLISVLEDSDLSVKFSLLNKLYVDKSQPSSIVVGFTGAPGSGKSSLLFEILRRLSQSFKPFVVFAVDPSSHFTGGAILGDRIRFSELNQVHFRSFATRGRYGGLSAVVYDAVRVAEINGFKHFAIETAGVGQNEVEIRHIVDYVFVVLNPTSGDAVQGIKAGLLEIADCIVVNKSDTGDVNLFLKDLELSLQILRKKNIPVIKTSVLTGEGITELVGLFSNIMSSQPNRSRWNLVDRVKKFFVEDIIPASLEGLQNWSPNSESTKFLEGWDQLITLAREKGSFAYSLLEQSNRFGASLLETTRNLLLASSGNDPEES